MREIKFRGKSVHSGAWLHGNIQVPAAPFDKYFMWNGANQYEVRPETVGQFTGLLDKTGKEIFEGDIVESDGSVVFSNLGSDRGARREVFWMKSGFTGVRIGNEFDKTNFSSADNWGNYQLYNSYRSLTVIGNIHDNPNLP